MESADSDSSEEPEIANSFPATEFTGENDYDLPSRENSSPFETKSRLNLLKDEGFVTWQRTMCVDAVRANGEWIMYSPSQAAVSEMKARRVAESVGLQDHDHLEPSRIFHAARLVTILDAYALYDPEIGYCQGMSDLLSPIIAVMEEDVSAFWWFVGFMKKARHSFRLDEVGIRRQLGGLLYQRRKLIVEKYSSMDEIMSECNSMGRFPVCRCCCVQVPSKLRDLRITSTPSLEQKQLIGNFGILNAVPALSVSDSGIIAILAF
ncbi:hypothetical protein OIU76_003846 [Salix suchowensis]|nr:hypothetical protein OIU76_003846 [Salix suchowensis]